MPRRLDPSAFTLPAIADAAADLLGEADDLTLALRRAIEQPGRRAVVAIAMGKFRTAGQGLQAAILDIARRRA